MKIKPLVTIKVQTSIVLEEEEIAALDAIAGYGTDEFIKCLYQHMGRSYLEPHEPGLRSLFKVVRETWPITRQALLAARGAARDAGST